MPPPETSGSGEIARSGQAQRLRRILIWLSAIALGLWVFMAVLFILWQPDLIIAIEATTRTFGYRATDPKFSAFTAQGFRLAGQGIAAGECPAGLVLPAANADLRFHVFDGVMTIELAASQGDSAGAIDPPEDGAGAKPRRLPKLAGFVRDPACGKAQGAFPVWGPGQIGETQRAPTHDSSGLEDLIVSGTISVYARSFQPAWLGGETLYPAIDREVVIPPGTQIGDLGQNLNWYWFGSVGMESGADFLTARVTTNQRDFRMFLPAARGGGGAPLRIGSVVALFNDPFLQRVQIVLAATFILAQTILAALQVLLAGGFDAAARTPRLAERHDSPSLEPARPARTLPPAGVVQSPPRTERPPPDDAGSNGPGAADGPGGDGTA